MVIINSKPGTFKLTHFDLALNVNSKFVVAT